MSGIPEEYKNVMVTYYHIEAARAHLNCVPMHIDLPEELAKVEKAKKFLEKLKNQVFDKVIELEDQSPRAKRRKKRARSKRTTRRRTESLGQ